MSINVFMSSLISLICFIYFSIVYCTYYFIKMTDMYYLFLDFYIIFYCILFYATVFIVYRTNALAILK